MSVESYPSTLPNPERGSLKSNWKETWKTDSSDVGSGRRRNRFTRPLAGFVYTMIVTDAQRVVMETFYATTLDNGVKDFNWTHPTTGTVYEMEFVSRPTQIDVADGFWRYTVGIQEI